MKTFKTALWVLFTIAFLAISVSLIGQNQEPLAVEIFNYVTPTAPKWVVVLSCVLIGAVITTGFFVFELMVLETRNIRLRRLNQKLERALAAANVGTGPSTISTTLRQAVPSLIEEGDV